MKKFIAMLIISGNIFGMQEESMPDNKIQEIQGSYNPTIGFFDSKKFFTNVFDNQHSGKIEIIRQEDTFIKPTKKNKPEYNRTPGYGEMSADRPKKGTINVCMNTKKDAKYEKQRIISFGFNAPYDTSFTEVFNRIKNKPVMSGLFMSNFKRIKEKKGEKKENGATTIEWISTSNLRCPIAIIEYKYN